MPVGPLLNSAPLGMRRGVGSLAAPPIGPLLNSAPEGMWSLVPRAAPPPAGPLRKPALAGILASSTSVVGVELVSSAALTVVATAPIEQTAMTAKIVLRFMMVLLAAIARNAPDGVQVTTELRSRSDGAGEEDRRSPRAGSRPRIGGRRAGAELGD